VPGIDTFRGATYDSRHRVAFGVNWLNNYEPTAPRGEFQYGHRALDGGHGYRNAAWWSPRQRRGPRDATPAGGAPRCYPRLVRWFACWVSKLDTLVCLAGTCCSATLMPHPREEAA